MTSAAPSRAGRVYWPPVRRQHLKPRGEAIPGGLGANEPTDEQTVAASQPGDIADAVAPHGRLESLADQHSHRRLTPTADTIIHDSSFDDSIQREFPWLVSLVAHLSSQN